MGETRTLLRAAIGPAAHELLDDRRAGDAIPDEMRQVLAGAAGEKNVGLYRLAAVCKPVLYRIPDDWAWPMSSRGRIN